MYAAEWPCCHDPLRFSLGSDDLLPRATTLARPTPALLSHLSVHPLCLTSTLAARAHSINPKAVRRPHTAHISALCQAPFLHARDLAKGPLCVQSVAQHGKSFSRICKSKTRIVFFEFNSIALSSINPPAHPTYLHLPQQACAHVQTGCKNTRMPRQSAGRTIQIRAHHRVFKLFHSRGLAVNDRVVVVLGAK